MNSIMFSIRKSGRKRDKKNYRVKRRIPVTTHKRKANYELARNVKMNNTHDSSLGRFEHPHEWEQDDDDFNYHDYSNCSCHQCMWKPSDCPMSGCICHECRDKVLSLFCDFFEDSILDKFEDLYISNPSKKAPGFRVKIKNTTRNTRNNAKKNKYSRKINYKLSRSIKMSTM